MAIRKRDVSECKAFYVNLVSKKRIGFLFTAPFEYISNAIWIIFETESIPISFCTKNTMPFYWKNTYYFFDFVRSMAASKMVCLFSFFSRGGHDYDGVDGALNYFLAITYSLWFAILPFLFFSRKQCTIPIRFFLLYSSRLVFFRFLFLCYISSILPYSTCRQSLHKMHTTSIAAASFSFSISSGLWNLLIP